MSKAPCLTLRLATPSGAPRQAPLDHSSETVLSKVFRYRFVAKPTHGGTKARALQMGGEAVLIFPTWDVRFPEQQGPRIPYRNPAVFRAQVHFFSRQSGVAPANQTKERAKTKSSYEFRPCPFFCEFWCFPLGKHARFTLNFCSGMPLRRVHELTFLWFGLPGPLLRQ